MTSTLAQQWIEKLESGTSQNLTLELVELLKSEAVQIADAIKEHMPEATSFTLRTNEVEDGALAVLLDAVANPHLHTLQCYGFDIQPEDTQAMADFLKSGVKLTNLALKKMGLNDQTVAPIGTALEQQSGLVELSLNENPCTGAAMEFFLPALREMHNLSTFYFNAQNMTAGVRTTVAQTFSPASHPNLVNCSISMPSNITSKNEQRLLKLLNDMCSMDFDILSLSELQGIEHRLTGLNIVAENAGDLDQGLIAYENYLNSLPVPPKGTRVNLDDLLKPDDRGLCALDHPQLWKNHPDLLAQLAATGQLSPASLEEMTPRDLRVIDYIAAFAPPLEAVAILANAGAPVRGEWLVHEDGSATETLLLFKTQYDGLNALFQHENWDDATMRDVNTVLGALTDETRDAIPNLHALRASVSRYAPRQAER